MNRDELESVIWQHWPARGPEAGQAVDAILAAADAYGLTQYGISAERRAALDVTLPPGVTLRTVHYQVPCPAGHQECQYTPTSCNSRCQVRRDVLATTVAADVTCRRCQGGPAYLEALARAVRA